ncbi:MAG: PCRF domain-containing protein, partial [Lactobacillus sp.]|nr:PCRF domain-containing protein [Lactobacillus sp.]
MSLPDFWQDQEAAQALINATNRLKEKQESYEQLASRLADEKTLLELLTEDFDPDLASEAQTQLSSLQADFHEYELDLLLAGPYDEHNLLLEIHPGAGGTEAQDWSQMLLRMYQRYCERHGF